MTYARVVIVLRLYLLEQCLNPVLRISIQTRKFVTFYKFVIHLGMHHTMGMLLMNKERSPCWGMDFSAEGGGKLAHIGWNQIHPGKWQNMFRKMFEHFCHAKIRLINLKPRFSVFRGKVLRDEKSPPHFLRSTFIPTHQFLCFFLFFLAIPKDWAGKRCGRKLGGQFGQFIAKSPL